MQTFYSPRAENIIKKLSLPIEEENSFINEGIPQDKKTNLESN